MSSSEPVRMSAAEFRKTNIKQKNKYRAIKTVVDGITFDSKREAQVYRELKQREKAGEIAQVELQPVYTFVINGVLIGTYRADFRFWDVANAKSRVWDVKGVVPPAFRRTQKLMRALHQIEVEIIK